MKIKKIIPTLVCIIAIHINANAQNWSLTGNAGTNVSTNFIGTTDNIALRMRTNNTVRMTILGNGRVGVATTSPNAPLHVNSAQVLSSISGIGAFQTGVTTSNNLVFDNSKIQARSNGIASSLLIQPYGGLVNLGTNSSEINIGDNSSFISLTSNSNGIVYMGQIQGLYAKLVTHGAIGNTTAAFGEGATGVSLQESYPGISFNSYFNGNFKAMSPGFGGNFTVDPTDGTLYYRALSNAATTGAIQSYSQPFVITNSGTIGINNGSPDNSVNLHVGQGTGAVIRIGSESQLQDAGTQLLSLSSTLIPSADNAYHIGNASFRYVDVWAIDGTINTSDRRDKTNIENIHYGLADIMKLRPVIFNWKDAPERGQKLGLIAQELQEVIKEAVVTKTFSLDENGNKVATENPRLGVYYSDLIPVVIKAIQEQQQTIEQKDAKISALENQLKNTNERLNNIELSLSDCCASFKTIQNNSSNEKAMLEQNNPNPFSTASIIKFYIPSNSSNAELKIFSMNGEELQSFSIPAKGKGQIEIAGNTLAQGVYTYVLIVDDKSIDTKQMVITK